MLKVGDKVILHRPKTTEEHPGWVSYDMDPLVGKKLIIAYISKECDILKIEECNWNYSPNWFTKDDGFDKYVERMKNA